MPEIAEMETYRAMPIPTKFYLTQESIQRRKSGN